MGIYEFMAGSPIITLCIVYMLTVTPLRMWKAWMRTRNIRSAGWPTAHLDADGDFKPEEEKVT